MKRSQITLHVNYKFLSTVWILVLLFGQAGLLDFKFYDFGFSIIQRQADLINNIYIYLLSFPKCFFCIFFPIKIVELALLVTTVFQGAPSLNMKVEEELQKCVEQNYGNLT